MKRSTIWDQKLRTGTQQGLGKLCNFCFGYARVGQQNQALPNCFANVGPLFKGRRQSHNLLSYDTSLGVILWKVAGNRHAISNPG